MRRLPKVAFVLVSLIAVTAALRAVAQNTGGGPPPQNGGGAGGGAGGHAGPGDQGGGPPPPGWHLLPHFVEEKLNLTDDQQQQIEQLEKDTQAKLAKILTPDQMKILQTARPPHHGGGPDGPQGGPGDGNGGGPGGDQAPPN